MECLRCVKNREMMDFFVQVFRLIQEGVVFSAQRANTDYDDKDYHNNKDLRRAD